MEERLDTWLNRQMEDRGIRSIYRLAREIGLDSEHVGEWLLGRAIPRDYESAQLAGFFGVPVQSIRELAERLTYGQSEREPRDTWGLAAPEPEPRPRYHSKALAPERMRSTALGRAYASRYSSSGRRVS